MKFRGVNLPVPKATCPKCRVKMQRLYTRNGGAKATNLWACPKCKTVWEAKLTKVGIGSIGG